MSQPEPEPLPDPRWESEADTVWIRRFLEAFTAGFTESEAAEFAESHTDIGLLRKLVRGGCPPDKLREILL